MSDIADRACRIARLQRRWDQIGESLDAAGELGKEHIPLLKEERELAAEAAGELGQQVRRYDLGELAEQQILKLIELNERGS